MTVHLGHCSVCNRGPRRLWCRWVDGAVAWVCDEDNWRLSRPDQVQRLAAMRERRDAKRAEARIRLGAIEREAKEIAVMLLRE